MQVTSAVPEEAAGGASLQDRRATKQPDDLLPRLGPRTGRQQAYCEEARAWTGHVLGTTGAPKEMKQSFDHRRVCGLEAVVAYAATQRRNSHAWRPWSTAQVARRRGEAAGARGVSLGDVSCARLPERTD